MLAIAAVITAGFGNGKDFYEYVAKDTMNRVIGKSVDIAPIPFEHMYFMSINDFDLLTGGIALGEIDLIQILEHAVKSDKLPESKKFDFGQHVYDKYPKTQPPRWLVDESECIFERCLLRLNEKS